ncbi:type IV pilus biogenesis protein PilM [unidentified bacterial endosymbiont]|uniref:type IV pilus biogenesis protein PilM n=1 Tax=unidentified bacterial endosymbiont TaxID=2355 RepID=UPI0020A0240A|nr:pilus assembly protein PilM [unidentified bacterial endosymbiont]
MWRSEWQVGLEIQPQQLLAVAARRHPTGWQLMHWWQQPLPLGTFCEAQLLQPEALSTTLAAWQQQLPSRYRLQCALPPALVLQAQLTLPTAIAPAQTAWAVQLSLPKLFPLPADDLAYDFCHPEGVAQPLLITVARRSIVAEWLAALRAARLSPSIIEITPCVLRALARQQQHSPQALLLHLQADSSLVVSPPGTPCRFSSLPTDAALFTAALQWCVTQCGVTPSALLLSGEVEGLMQASADPPSALWRPFAHFRAPLPALPDRQELFAVACGLATRHHEDAL